MSLGRGRRQKNNVRDIRESKMMSKAELARKTGLSVQTIDRVEKGYFCRLDTKRKILVALEMDLEDRDGVFLVSDR
ncbi:MAG: helix-turn-helix transcriptional regulator [Nitrospinota bacterium]|nr:helix-turn-helix transcriptional regulator [Nitrospinota bacterium]